MNDPEVQAILDAYAGLRRWGRRAIRHSWAALIGRTLAATLCFALLAGLALFGRPGLEDHPAPHVKFDQAWDLDGHEVTRTEWINRVCGADGSLCG